MVGLGYIGLPTAAIMASRGLNVIGVDVDQKAVDTINRGEVHIVEPDLDIVVRSVITTGNLRAVTKPEAAEAFLIAVPTPFKDNKTADLRYIEAAIQSVSAVLEEGNLIILESTCPVGTTDFVCQKLSELRPDLRLPVEGNEDCNINVAYCPERVLPGAVLQELVNNDRIVGGMTQHCAQRAADLYASFVKGDCLRTDAKTAEMCKLTENAFRDVNIAFANELSLISENLGVNVWELISLANRHPRVNILEPGPGVGGHCIAVDPWFIVSSCPEHSVLIKAAREVNDGKPNFVVSRVLARAERFKNPRIACLGLAFKADIDDLRESPSVDIVKEIATMDGVELFVAEPHVDQLPESLASAGNINFVDEKTAIEQADIVVGLVDHKRFKGLSPLLLKEKIVIDVRGIWRD
jgi:UDP-N-acetyl-D-mannosaminuronic acid dehydrogenase